MGAWRNLGKVGRKGVRKHRMVDPQPSLHFLTEGRRNRDQHRPFGP